MYKNWEESDHQQQVKETIKNIKIPEARGEEYRDNGKII